MMWSIEPSYTGIRECPFARITARTSSYDASAGTHRKITTFAGEDRNPVFADDDKAFYFAARVADDSHLLADGSFLTADIRNCRVLIIDPQDNRIATQWGEPGHCKHNPPHQLAHPNGATPMEGGAK